jgi:hypothetical protein
MATAINSGFTNNINVIQSRVNGAHSVRYTDRPIDIDGDGSEEQVTITHVSGHAVGTPSAPGGKTRSSVSIPAGVARTIISEVTETDGGVNDDFDVNEFTEGVS